MLTHKKKALSFILCLTMLLSVVVLFIPGEVALPAYSMLLIAGYAAIGLFTGIVSSSLSLKKYLKA